MYTVCVICTLNWIIGKVHNYIIFRKVYHVALHVQVHHVDYCVIFLESDFVRLFLIVTFDSNFRGIRTTIIRHIHCDITNLITCENMNKE